MREILKRRISSGDHMKGLDCLGSVSVVKRGDWKRCRAFGIREWGVILWCWHAGFACRTEILSFKYTRNPCTNASPPTIGRLHH
eukprot:1392267-Amorphochlora_amoeboformis.AAC.3